MHSVHEEPFAAKMFSALNMQQFLTIIFQANFIYWTPLITFIPFFIVLPIS